MRGLFSIWLDPYFGHLSMIINGTIIMASVCLSNTTKNALENLILTFFKQSSSGGWVVKNTGANSSRNQSFADPGSIPARGMYVTILPLLDLSIYTAHYLYILRLYIKHWEWEDHILLGLVESVTKMATGCLWMTKVAIFFVLD